MNIGLQNLKINFRIHLRDKTKKFMGERKRKGDTVKFSLQQFLKERLIVELVESAKLSREELMTAVRKWDFVELGEGESTISYRPKYPAINCWESLVKFLKEPERRLLGLQLEEGIELETYWEIREDLKKRLSPGSPVRQIEIKGTDKRYLYYLGEKLEQPFSKVEFLSKCDKVVNSTRKTFELIYSDKGDKRGQADTKENEWVEGWFQLREKYFKEQEIRRK